MASLQFPPSSPVLHGAEPCSDDPKGKELPRGRPEYPTPNPSSTVGRSSSPARHETDIEAPSKEKNREISSSKGLSDDTTTTTEKRVSRQTVRFTEPVSTDMQSLKVPGKLPEPSGILSNKNEFNIVNPHASVMRVPLLPDRSTVTIGRSSKTCDFHFKDVLQSHDKRISRCHVKIEYPGDQIVITCLGYNGMGTVIPKVCFVKKIADKSFELYENTTPLSAENVSKSIHLDYQHTEFDISRGESVRMPRFANILLQIGHHVFLVNPENCDEDVTDYEECGKAAPKEVKKNLSSEVEQKSEEGSNSEKCETPLESHVTYAYIPPIPAVSTGNKAKTFLTPSKTLDIDPHTTQKVQRGFVSEESTPSKPYRGTADKTNVFPTLQKHPSKKASTPLATRSPNVPEQSLLTRRAQSEEPQGSVKKAKQEQQYDTKGELIINEQCLEGLLNIGEIENILVNHLAFSRLSSAPASFLNTILEKVSVLSLEQLRAVLYETACIGVIYRQGTDAAGKPLQEEYYYMPEKDRDPERNKLVYSVRGHGGLRACRKTHKQYYWKKPAPIKK